MEITDGGDFDCLISLNMPDTDPHSGNQHALFDRVGLLVSYHKGGHYYETAIHPNIDLPLTEEAVERIAQLVREQYDLYCHCEKPKED